MLGELNETEIQEILKTSYVGRIGCTDGTEVYIVPVNYRYEDNSVLCYSLEGLKIAMMRQHPTVCFEVDHIKNSFNWKCVIINGVFEEITDPQELSEIRPHYTEYMLRKKVSLTALPETEVRQASVSNHNHDQVFYRIRFKKVSGRFENGFS